MGNLSDVCGFYSQLFNFLAEVTGPLVASQIAAAKAEESENRYDDRYENTQSTTRVQAAETVRGAMTVAVVLGVSACVALEFGAENVLRWSGGDGLASSTGVDGSGMMHQAEMYLRVRALSAPAALIGTVSVGAYRGLLDTKTPLLVSGAANAVNLGEFRTGNWYADVVFYSSGFICSSRPYFDLRVRARSRVRGGGCRGGDHRRGVDRRGGVLENARRRRVAPENRPRDEE